jgi:hypothetical protein
MPATADAVRGRTTNHRLQDLEANQTTFVDIGILNSMFEAHNKNYTEPLKKLVEETMATVQPGEAAIRELRFELINKLNKESSLVWQAIARIEKNHQKALDDAASQHQQLGVPWWKRWTQWRNK